MSYHRDKAFSAKDVDWSSGKCTGKFQGGWWYASCHYANLNGRYIKENETVPHGEGIIWREWKGMYYSLKAVSMKLRPAGFIPGEQPNTLAGYFPTAFALTSSSFSYRP